VTLDRTIHLLGNATGLRHWRAGPSCISPVAFSPTTTLLFITGVLGSNLDRRRTNCFHPYRLVCASRITIMPVEVYDDSMELWQLRGLYKVVPLPFSKMSRTLPFSVSLPICFHYFFRLAWVPLLSLRRTRLLARLVLSLPNTRAPTVLPMTRQPLLQRSPIVQVAAPWCSLRVSRKTGTRRSNVNLTFLRCKLQRLHTYPRKQPHRCIYPSTRQPASPARHRSHSQAHPGELTNHFLV
jgi:hypothetical protein